MARAAVDTDKGIDDEGEALEASVNHMDKETDSELRDGWRKDGNDEEKRGEMQRMHAALTRTQPKRRSCETRLALTEWLHRRLGRLEAGNQREQYDRLHDSPGPPNDSSSATASPRRYRMLITLLRFTLRWQLNNSTAASGAQ